MEIWQAVFSALSRSEPSREFALLMIWFFFLSRFFSSVFAFPIFILVSCCACWRMWSVRFCSASCGFSEGLDRFANVLEPSVSILLMRSLSFIIKGLIAQRPRPIFGALRLWILTVIIWWSVGIPGFSIDHTEAFSKMLLVV